MVRYVVMKKLKSGRMKIVANKSTLAAAKKAAGKTGKVYKVGAKKRGKRR